MIVMTVKLLVLEFQLRELLKIKNLCRRTQLLRRCCFRLCVDELELKSEVLGPRMTVQNF